MTATRAARTPQHYGPVQFPTRLGLQAWAFERAREHGLIPDPDLPNGRWSAALVDAVAADLERIRAHIGTQPDFGAYRAAEVLSERFGVTVEPTVLLELDRRGLIPKVAGEQGFYKGHQLYSGLALERFADREALLQCVETGRGLTFDGAAAHCRVRRVDIERLAERGWLPELTRVHSYHQRPSAPPLVRLFRKGDLDILLAHPALDWDAARAAAPGRPSPFAKLPPPPPDLYAGR